MVNFNMRVLITGGSRGIGAAIAARYAAIYAQKATIAVLGRSLTEASHPKTPGTLLKTVEQIEAFGAKGIPFRVDMRDNASLSAVVEEALVAMDGLDILINNASALHLSRTPTIKQLDLLNSVNTKSTLVAIDRCKPSLETSRGAIVTLSPPLHLGNLDWISKHPAYTISKYSMTLATLGAASDRVRANTLWPRHTVATCATKRLEKEGYKNVHAHGRPVGDVARAVCELSVSHWNAQTLYDDDVLDLPSTNAPLDMFARVSTKHLRCD